MNAFSSSFILNSTYNIPHCWKQRWAWPVFSLQLPTRWGPLGRAVDWLPKIGERIVSYMEEKPVSFVPGTKLWFLSVSVKTFGVFRVWMLLQCSRMGHFVMWKDEHLSKLFSDPRDMININEALDNLSNLSLLTQIGESIMTTSILPSASHCIVIEQSIESFFESSSLYSEPDYLTLT